MGVRVGFYHVIWNLHNISVVHKCANNVQSGTFMGKTANQIEGLWETRRHYCQVSYPSEICVLPTYPWNCRRTYNRCNLLQHPMFCTPSGALLTLVVEAGKISPEHIRLFVSVSLSSFSPLVMIDWERFRYLSLLSRSCQYYFVGI